MKKLIKKKKEQHIEEDGKNGYAALFFCPYCNREFAKTSLWCPHCGKKVFEK